MEQQFPRETAMLEATGIIASDLVFTFRKLG